MKYQLGFAHDPDINAKLSDIIGGAIPSSTSMPVIAMGLEVPSGIMTMKGRFLDIQWSETPSKRYYDRVTDELQRVAEVLRAKYVESPFYKLNFHQFLTAHPLGGCCMGASKDSGVVDVNGEVFDYPGLYIADGSITPGPIGVNPALTIAALADRCADRLIEKWSKKI